MTTWHVTGAARQWENWIAEQAAGIVRREMAPIETWESEGGSQRATSLLPYPFTRCPRCGTAARALDLVMSGLRPPLRLCCMSCHQRDYPEDGQRLRARLAEPLSV